VKTNLLGVVDEVRRHLAQNDRVSFRMLRRQFDLDDETLEELIEELVDIQCIARREANALAWSEAAPVKTVPAPEPDPRSYMSKHLADKSLTARSALEGERKQVTVLCADVKGSMELAEQLDPEEWSRIMQRFFQILSEGVERFEGFVDKFTGDGIMALFGAPLAHEDRLGLNSSEVIVGKISDDLRIQRQALLHRRLRACVPSARDHDGRRAASLSISRQPLRGSRCGRDREGAGQ
jgi:class 3 adenylate cyclase